MRQMEGYVSLQKSRQRNRCRCLVSRDDCQKVLLYGCSRAYSINPSKAGPDSGS
jgi:hypothetical protein